MRLWLIIFSSSPLRKAQAMLRDVVFELLGNELDIAPRSICMWSASDPVALRVDCKTLQAGGPCRLLGFHLGG